MLKKKAIAIVLPFTLLLSGCLDNQTDDKKSTVKVLYYNSESFFNKYGNVFQAKNPNISIEVVSLDPYFKAGLSEEKFLEVLETEKPDVFYGFNLQEYAGNGKLLNLDTYIKNSKIVKPEKMNSNILNYIRNKGGGQLYALSPTFQSKATFYNKTLFDKFGIEYPKEQMTWEELFTLASRFPTSQGDDKISGYYHNAQGPYGVVSEFAETEKLGYVNSERNKVVLNTDRWKKVFNTVIDGYRKGYIRINDGGEAQGGDPFLNNAFNQGRSAMMVEYIHELRYLPKVDFEWGITTEPVSSSSPNESATVQPNELFGINADSKNIDSSWKLIEYINSEEFAEQNKKSGQDGSLSTYLGDMNLNGVNLEPFYKLGPQDEYSPPIPVRFFFKFNEMIDNSMDNVIKNKQSLDEILLDLEKKGQLELDLARNEAPAK
ncbi:ABC transporter substrate-binding protein [Paenibacillus puerhi]|uniref:ABC transporter substrate-binding protein n=1 Tax=Paenibacillus puerhi TaxID=2692622 RepID=UPI00135BBBF4|nr:extracellular solute-binding protein [Paenibacillus puerhi]